MNLLARTGAAILSGALLAQAYGLHPWWPLAWAAPIPLLCVIVRASRLGAFLYGALAGAVSMTLTVSYFIELSGPAPTAIITLVKACMWGGLALAARAGARRLPAWAAVFVFPALLAGIETLIAAASPHGSAGSLAYSQMDFVPAIQIASLGGAPAITFVVSLFASAVALLIGARTWRHAIAPALVVAAALGFGVWRLSPGPSGEMLPVALFADNQFDGVPENWRAVWSGYAADIERAADQDYRLIVLPEKIAHLSAEDRDLAVELLAEVARRRDLLLVFGADVDTESGRFNRAYALSREAPAQPYDKRHLVPGFESHFELGAGNLDVEHAGSRFGVAICKDMDFPDLGRGYAGVDVMLVPAWDFERDGWLHSRMAILRGVEDGYAVVRSARNGSLTVSDAFGRVTAEANGGPLVSLTGEAPREGAGPTLYARIGDAFGWAMLALAALLIGWSAVRGRAGQGGGNGD